MNITQLKNYISSLESLCDKYALTNSLVNSEKDRKNVILAYLRTMNPSYSGAAWEITGGFQTDFKDYVIKNNKSLHDTLYKIFKNNPSEKVYDSSNYLIDISHMIATADGYFQSLFQFLSVPNSWTGWAGDLATGMADTTAAYKFNLENGLHDSLDSVAKNIIGNNNYSCGLTDLRADADAIEICNNLKNTNLSLALNNYYNTTRYKSRFNILINSIGSKSTLESDVKGVMTTKRAKAVLLPKLAENPTQEVINSCCKAFANYCIGRVNNH